MKRDKRQGPPDFATQTLTRRSLLDWLGKATVLALGSELLAACTTAAGTVGEVLDAGSRDVPTGSDPGLASDPGGGVDTTAKGDAGPLPDGFAFEPADGDEGIFASWPERTVDKQDLMAILESWRLQVDGLVESPLDLSFADLLRLARQDQLVDFHCVEGWSVYDVPWNGVHLSTLFELAKPTAAATHVSFFCEGGVYTESLPLDVALEPKTLLAYGVGGSTLPLKTGFPTRLVVPRKFAYKSAKYVNRIELASAPLTGFWEQYGYTYEADVQPERLREGKY